ncbi:MAG: acyl-CoA dehydratase activase-related protein [Bacillota bacterium]
MGEVVGIPRALLYYYYYPMWKVFFESLGQRVITSGETTKAVVDAGIQVTVDEACLPVKVFHGHALALAGRCDYIFVPRLVAVERGAFICPKFMGLPDMVRCNCKNVPKIIDSCVNLSRTTREYIRAVYSTGRLFGNRALDILVAHNKARAALGKFARCVESGLTPDEAMAAMGLEASEAEPARQATAAGSLGRNPGPKQAVVGLVGHPYVIYDPFVSMNIIRRLRGMGVTVVTADMLPPAITEREAARFPKRVFWTLGRRLLGAGFYFLRSGSVDGCLHVSAFACGPDSLIGELLEREYAKYQNVPFTTITVDEHTGEAGIMTRVEAFVDVITRRRRV